MFRNSDWNYLTEACRVFPQAKQVVEECLKLNNDRFTPKSSSLFFIDSPVIRRRMNWANDGVIKQDTCIF
jgi:hypothetical protein